MQRKHPPIENEGRNKGQNQNDKLRAGLFSEQTSRQQRGDPLVKRSKTPFSNAFPLGQNPNGGNRASSSNECNASTLHKKNTAEVGKGSMTDCVDLASLKGIGTIYGTGVKANGNMNSSVMSSAVTGLQLQPLYGLENLHLPEALAEKVQRDSVRAASPRTNLRSNVVSNSNSPRESNQIAIK